MSRCVVFNEKISADILAACQKSMTKYRIMMKRKSDGCVKRGSLDHYTKDKLQRLCDMLNRQFRDREYYVVEVQSFNYELVQKVA